VFIIIYLSFSTTTQDDDERAPLNNYCISVQRVLHGDHYNRLFTYIYFSNLLRNDNVLNDYCFKIIIQYLKSECRL